ncbi:MAG: ParA family protein, partial [Actinobacteria bacterium]|nr:ParA family protein [Actinomycetota bacterium]
VIDLDPQGNATSILAAEEPTATAADLLSNPTLANLHNSLTPCAWEVAPGEVDVIASSPELIQHDAFKSAAAFKPRLARALEKLDGYDLVLIDCPPSLGLITINAFAAATDILVPMQCEFYALEGLTQLQRIVTLVQKNLNPSLKISKVVLTMYDPRTTLTLEVAKEVERVFPNEICKTRIPRTVRLAEAPSFGQPITVFDPTSKGATAYVELAKEILNG